MATITPATTYPTGTTLDVTNHNENVYSLTSGRGLISEANGGLNASNLAPGFTVTSSRVMSEEAVSARQDASTFTMDIFSNAFNIPETESEIVVPIAGLTQRVYLPYDVSVLVWQWSYFMAAWRPFLSRSAVVDPTNNGNQIPDLWMRVYIDGVEQTSFFRSIPVTALYTERDHGGGTYPLLFNADAAGAVWTDQAKMQINVLKGWHELSVKLFIPRIRFKSEDVDMRAYVPETVYAPSGDSGLNLDSRLYMRVTYGSRSVKCIAFK